MKTLDDTFFIEVAIAQNPWPLFRHTLYDPLSSTTLTIHPFTMCQEAGMGSHVNILSVPVLNR